MIGKRSPLFLLTALGSLGLLFACLVILAWRQEGAPLTAVLALSDKPAEGKPVFESGFGRLDELVPFAGGISPVAAAVVAPVHGPEFRDREWVKSRSPEGWTLQYMASRDEAGVKRFLAGLENRASYVYFEHPQDGEIWFVVTSGDYATRELALGLAESETLTGDIKPFPRRFGAYQEALSAADPAAADAVPSAALPETGVPESSGMAAPVAPLP